MGGLAFMSSMSDNGGGVANATHLGGLLVGYVYLKGLRMRLSPWAEVKYRYVKWKIGRARKKFDVYSGGRAPTVAARTTAGIAAFTEPRRLPTDCRLPTADC